jgi:hypothetical protein
MVLRTLVAAVVLSASTILSTNAGAAETNQCSLGGSYMVRSVAPYQTFEDAGYTTYTQLRGAEIIVPAHQGLTREYLQRVLTFQLASGECDFGVRDAAVTVLSSGDAFSVRIAGHDDKSAAEILRHAQQMVK